jgi:hypothetical protein
MMSAPLVCAQEVLSNPTLGVSATNQPGWKAISDAQRRALMGSTELKQPGLKELVATLMSKPFLIFTKLRDAPPQPIITAVVAHIDASAPDDPVALLERMTRLGPMAFADYRLVDKPGPVQIGGRKGAYCRATYTLKTRGGGSYPVSFETWQVIRGDYYFLIGAVSAQPEDPQTAGEIQRIINSIKIEDAKAD